MDRSLLKAVVCAIPIIFIVAPNVRKVVTKIIKD
ncbi:hypothetical protein [Aliarcobacter cryaerophilus]|jgi:hypothetical protein|nr:hypothetical protein [Aliarcobacter cryaerophilus]